ncbi:MULTISPECIES: dihydrodipicolinate synthase family protein [Microbacterium]|uniref:Dihydrodipicolinate synthase family protein n=1 Tax=Microbacterium sufflavum TaxID=2851649 RepID=A0ABY4ICY0_9MICO|nr:MULTISPECIES: dihydrodipicolinate synthase family protein [Microbacterium]MBN6191595.1 dihydrodipicolinate synthase family protein [Aneurinibacillus sp. BA2021]MCK2025573.1 dihydrodipicolinate synthase family protein [Microbacterium sufflavum]UPL10434.1 dihydrodipicolinate synthase family protein [Microbacterium sufflavum]
MSSASPAPSFSGVVPPVATPLLPDGTIDHASLTRLVERLIDEGVSGLFALGSTGETAYFTDDQRVELLRTIVAANAGRVPVIAGAIELTAPRIIETARRLVEAGAQAIVTTAPLYTLNSAAEVADHFRTIAAAIDAPLWAYDVPVRVHTKLGVDLLVQLGTEGVIQGVKDSSGDDVSFRRLVAANEAAGRPLQLLTGHEVVVDAMALVGAAGVVPGLANVEAAGYVRLWNAAQQGDWTAARAEQERINRLFDIVFQPRGLSGDATGVGAFKAAMHARGIIDHATMADTVQALDADAVAGIRAILDELGLLPVAV